MPESKQDQTLIDLPDDIDLDSIDDLTVVTSQTTTAQTTTQNDDKPETTTQPSASSAPKPARQKQPSKMEGGKARRPDPAAGSSSPVEAGRLWTQDELAIMQVLLDLSTNALTTEEKADLAGVSSYAWRKALRDRELMDEVRAVIMADGAARMPAVMHAAFNAASQDSPHGFRDRKMLLDRFFGPVSTKHDHTHHVDLGAMIARASSRVEQGLRGGPVIDVDAEPDAAISPE